MPGDYFDGLLHIRSEGCNPFLCLLTDFMHRDFTICIVRRSLVFSIQHTVTCESSQRNHARCVHINPILNQISISNVSRMKTTLSLPKNFLIVYNCDSFVVNEQLDRRLRSVLHKRNKRLPNLNKYSCGIARSRNTNNSPLS